MNLLIRVCRLAAVLALLGLGSALAQQPVAGRDYTLINPPQPTASGNRIEVLEFFWYGCIHCYNLEAPLKAWLKRKPADVDFRYVPAAFDASWLPLARAYYALDAMGAVAKHHDAIFTAIHRDNQKALLGDTRALADFLAGKGLDKQKFLETYNSFAVNTRTQRTMELTRAYDIPGTPALVVNGRYLTGPSMMVGPDNRINFERFFQVVDELIAQARKERGGKK